MLPYIRNILLLLLLATAGVTIHAQVQVGATIIASENNFAFGQNVQLSENGMRLVISGYGTSDQGVALFDNVNGEWVEQSFMVPSDFPDSQTIYSVAMSPDGNKIAVGSVENSFENNGNVQVFQYNGTAWFQKGYTISSEFDNELFGRSIGISNDGNRVVVGARLNSEKAAYGGRVAVFQYTNNNWSQLGQSIFGVETGFKVGTSVAISSDGAFIFMGSNSYYAYRDRKLKRYEGGIEAYRWLANEWVKTKEVAGEEFDHFGFDVAISDNGEIYAAGASQFQNGNGYLKTYYNSNNNGILEYIGYVQATQVEFLGSSVSLSGDGNRVVVGAVLGENQLYSGYVSIYENTGDEYVSLGAIQGGNSIPKFGSTVAMSSDGNTIAVGALYYDYHNANGVEVGSVRVYDISELQGPEPPEVPEPEPEINKNITIYPSPATNELNCINCEHVSEWYIADVTGKRILVNQGGDTSNFIDVSILQTGIYYVFFISENEDVSVKKFIRK